MKIKYLFLILSLIFNFSLLTSCTDDSPEFSENNSSDKEESSEGNGDTEVPKEPEIFYDEDPEGFQFEIINEEAAVIAFPEKNDLFIPHYFVKDGISYPVTKILSPESLMTFSSLHIPSTINEIHPFTEKVENLYIEDISSWANIDFEYKNDSGHSLSYNCYSNPILYSENVYINNLNAEESDLIIPDDVKIIKPFAFSQIKISNLTLGKNVEEIGLGAFQLCRNLKNIYFNDNLKKIGWEAFSYTDLETLKFPENLLDIGESAFYNCKKLETLYLPDSINKIRLAAFNYTSVKYINITSLQHWLDIDFEYEDAINFYPPFLDEYDLILDGKPLKDIEIPKGTTSIRECAFWNSRIESVNIPNTVNSIAWSSFSQCNHVKEFDIPGSVKEICGFSSNKNLVKIILNVGTTSVNLHTYPVFSSNPSLETMILPSSLKSIDMEFTLSCPSLNSVYLYATDVPSISIFSVEERVSKIDLYVPKEAIDKYKADKNWSCFNIIPM